MNLIKDFAGLFFPDVCYNCGNTLFRNERIVCTRCALHLPETNFHKDPDNPVSKVFWGRVPLQAATALYYYKKGGAVQNLIHQMKYNGRKEIGIYLGNVLGSEIKDLDHFETIDCILPIPLHRKRFKKRGFNQAEMIAIGLGQALNKEVDIRSLYRNISSDTQTKKSRYRRWENVSEIFKLREDHTLKGKHVLVVDDVITTGATMEACLQTLLKVPEIKLSVVSAAFAHK